MLATKVMVTNLWETILVGRFVISSAHFVTICDHLRPLYDHRFTIVGLWLCLFSTFTLDVMLLGWFLEFYILIPHRDISGQVVTFESAHSSQLNSATQLGNQATSIIIRYPTQSHYPDTELTN